MIWRPDPLAATYLMLLVPISFSLSCRSSDSDSPPTSPNNEITFNQDIAPIVFEHCAVCHRDGGSAPFSLLTYDDVESRAEQIVHVTESGYMPPWLPERDGRFAGERKLTADQLAAISAWVDGGGPEGDATQLPPTPQFSPGWQLGEPDLVVTMPQPYTLPADGRDIYRNFVIPIPTDQLHNVRGMELMVKNLNVVHHAFMLVDETGSSRVLDRNEPGIGFDGMEIRGRASSPDGHFVSWQPGEIPRLTRRDMTWRLRPETDLVLQMHLRPTGKPEPIQPSVGFYFSNDANTGYPFKISLRNRRIEIPPGETSYVATDEYTLPVHVEVLAVLPHAHYLGKSLEGIATLPDGSHTTLVTIPDWNFDWQSVFYYKQPLKLPKGTVLQMEYTYDNSAGNPHNPNDPPKPVRFGLQATDEMGELWLQVLTGGERDRNLLARDFAGKVSERIASYDRWVLENDPKNLEAKVELGKMLIMQGKSSEALRHLEGTVYQHPDSGEAHYTLALAYTAKRQPRSARIHFETAIELQPDHAAAHYELGGIYYRRGELDKAAKHLEQSARFLPGLANTHYNLGLVYLKLGKPTKAAAQFERAIELTSDEDQAAPIRRQLEFLREK